MPAKPGPLLDHITGRRLGIHQGLWSYTIGQGAKLPGMSERLYVASKDIKANALTLVPGS
jgi:tRNA U34 2-thiouridine synthase MnmA/TrmU